MPARNGSGPQGTGPMTGRGMGNCIVPDTSGSKSSQVPHFVPGRGRGRGFGRGLGLGLGARSVQAQSPQGELGMLKQHAKVLEEELRLVQGRIQDAEPKA